MILETELVALITVYLPMVPVPLETARSAANNILNKYYVSERHHLCDELLTEDWGKTSSEERGFLFSITSLTASSSAVLEQLVEKKLLQIQSTIHTVVSSRILYYQIKLPADIDLVINPVTLAIPKGFEIVNDLDDWHWDLRNGGRAEYWRDNAWVKMLFDAGRIENITPDGESLKFEIDGIFTVEADQLYPWDSDGWKHKLSAGDTIRVRPSKTSGYHRVDWIRSCLHNFNTSQVQICWASDGLTETIDYQDIFTISSTEI